jgi:hypothetical protein
MAISVASTFTPPIAQVVTYLVRVVDDRVDAGNLLKDREPERHDKRAPPFAMEDLAPRRGLVVLAQRQFHGIQ